MGDAARMRFVECSLRGSEGGPRTLCISIARGGTMMTVASFIYHNCPLQGAHSGQQEERNSDDVSAQPSTQRRGQTSQQNGKCSVM
mmetsp:Transcript_34891/g.68891  ORF Transcript_34891/g.68891 Transcript_34891/m.68891 type:complete len:86 (-) Transcript_34891:16-273(-)